MAELGEEDWTAVAERMAIGRTAVQCRKRFRFYLRDDIKADRWTEAEVIDRQRLHSCWCCGAGVGCAAPVNGGYKSRALTLRTSYLTNISIPPWVLCCHGGGGGLKRMRP